MSTNELRELSVQDLEGKLLELRKEQFNLRMKRATGSLDKFHQFARIRKTIAQIKTIITEKNREVNHG